MLQTNAIENELRGLLPGDQLRPATREDAVLGVLPQFVAEPANEQQLAAVLSLANHAGLAVAPRGGGSKLAWGNPPSRADLVLSTARLNRILEHVWADLTVTVEAGCTLQSLQATLAQHGQRLAFDGLWPEHATLGGALSTNDSGALRLRFGALRDLIIGVTLALPDGTLASSGGKVVKNVAGYDLPKLSTGAFGTLGIITRAVFRLHPVPHAVKTFSFASKDFQGAQDQILALHDSKLAHTSLQLRAGSNGSLQTDILFEATEAGLAAQESQLRNLFASEKIEPSSQTVWSARQEICNEIPGDAALAKISILPANAAHTLGQLSSIANSQKLDWSLVLQATGLGMLRLTGNPEQLSVALTDLRAEIESATGSLVILERPRELYSFDAWGVPGDAISLMRAVKHQLDPKHTLNPGRFVGGI